MGGGASGLLETISGAKVCNVILNWELALEGLICCKETEKKLCTTITKYGKHGEYLPCLFHNRNAWSLIRQKSLDMFFCSGYIGFHYRKVQKITNLPRGFITLARIHTLDEQLILFLKLSNFEMICTVDLFSQQLGSIENITYQFVFTMSFIYFKLFENKNNFFKSSAMKSSYNINPLSACRYLTLSHVGRNGWQIHIL